MKQLLTIVLLTLSIKSYSQIWIYKSDSVKGNISLNNPYPTNELLIKQPYKWTGTTWIKSTECDSLKLELQFWKYKYNELLYQYEKVKLEELNRVQLPYNKHGFMLFDDNKMFIQKNSEYMTTPKDSIIFELNNQKFKMYKDSTGLNNHIYLIKD